MQINGTPKVLLIDQAADRKQRIAALKNAGYAVYPALNIPDARSRCRPGAYDLIIVNAAEGGEAALELCEEIRHRLPKQLLLLAAGPEATHTDRDYLVSSEPQRLLERVERLLKSDRATELAPAA